jgi:hypothetical protein
MLPMTRRQFQFSVLFIFVMTIDGAHSAMSATVTKVKPVDEWIAEWRLSNPSPPAGVMLSAAVISNENGDKIKPYFLKDADFNRLGILQVASNDTIKLTIALNGKQSKTSCLKSEIAYMKCFDVDTLIVINDDKWSVKRKVGTDLTPILNAPSAVKKPTAKDIQKWLAGVFQFDGIVLAVDNGLVLTTVSPANIPVSGQSLLLANSASSYTLGVGKNSGSGLMQSVERAGSFAVMRLISTDDLKDTVPIGAKFISEKKK